VVGVNPDPETQSIVKTMSMRYSRARAARSTREKASALQRLEHSPSPEDAWAAALGDEVTSETSPPESERSLWKRSGRGAWDGGLEPERVPARGNRIATEAPEVGNVVRRGLGIVQQDKPSLALHRARQKRGRCGKPTTRSAEAGMGNRSAILRCLRASRKELTGDERVMTPRPCVIGVC